MKSAKRTLFEERVSYLNGLFATGNLPEALDQFSEPLTIYVEDRLVSSPDRTYLAGMIREFGSHLAAQGATDMGGEIIAFHESARGFRALVQGRAKFNGECRDTMKVEYFCRMVGDDFKIEMLVVTDLADSTIKHLKSTKKATIAEGMPND